MDRSIVEWQQLLAAISDLPEEALVELASFLDYLRYKSAQQKELTQTSASFLLAVAGLGTSGQQDVSERDEEIYTLDRRDFSIIRPCHCDYFELFP